MKNENQIKQRQDKILKQLAVEEQPLNYIYGLAQFIALKWVLEVSE